MSGPRYAAQTDVSSDRSQAEIQKIVARYGARRYVFGWGDGRAMVGFEMNDRQVRFTLPLPDREDAQFWKTPTGRDRAPVAAEKEYEQAVRQRWRALALVIKAKFEAVETGIVTFEQEFGMHMVLPDGKTAGEHVIPAIAHAYETGYVAPMLQIEGRPA